MVRFNKDFSKYIENNQVYDANDNWLGSIINDDFITADGSLGGYFSSDGDLFEENTTSTENDLFNFEDCFDF